MIVINCVRIKEKAACEITLTIDPNAAASLLIDRENSIHSDRLMHAVCSALADSYTNESIRYWKDKKEGDENDSRH